MKNVITDKGAVKKKVNKTNSNKVYKESKQYIHWSSYIKVDMFADLRSRWNQDHFLMFKNFPFGHFLDMQQLKVQPQLLRNLLYAETDNDRDDMFIFSLNGKELHFGKREFSVVSGLKFGNKSDFFSNSKVRNNLKDRYYPKLDKVKKCVFYSNFVDENFVIMEEDIYNIGMLYFIIRFLEPNLPRNYITKFHFDLVDSDGYLNYDWSTECFQILHKSCSHDLKRHPSSFIFGGFHLALQI